MNYVFNFIVFARNCKVNLQEEEDIYESNFILLGNIQKFINNSKSHFLFEHIWKHSICRTYPF